MASPGSIVPVVSISVVSRLPSLAALFAPVPVVARSTWLRPPGWKSSCCKARMRYSCDMAVVVHWNGKDVPEELHALPQGRYVMESVDVAPALSQEEEAGLDRAIDSLRRGNGVPADDVFSRVEKRLQR
jgi:hypothetical protein